MKNTLNVSMICRPQVMMFSIITDVLAVREENYCVREFNECYRADIVALYISI